MFKSRLFLAGIGMPIVGIILLAVSINRSREDDRLDAAGETVPGRVVGGHETYRRRGGRSYTLDVAYQSKDGRVSHRRSFSVPKTVYEQAGQQDFVRVTFLPAEPNVARVGGRRDNGVGMGIGAVLLVGGVGLLAYFFLKRKRGQTGPPVPGPGGTGGPPLPPLPPLPGR